MVIWLASLPRAGNTLFRLLLHHYCDVDTYSFYNDLMFFRHDVAEMIGHMMLPDALEEVIQDYERRKAGYAFIKTHHHPDALPGTHQAAMCIIRDPRDAAVSLAHYKNWKGKVPFDKALWIVVRRYNWTNFIQAWREMPNVCVVKYEDMRREPRGTLESALDTLRLDLPIVRDTPLPPFRRLHKKLPQFFRQGKSNVWQDVLSGEQLETVLKRHGEMMQEMGYL